MRATAIESVMMKSIQTCGAIAQLGERIVRNDEVVGSIPTSSTIESITSKSSVRPSTVFVPSVVSCRLYHPAEVSSVLPSSR